MAYRNFLIAVLPMAALIAQGCSSSSSDTTTTTVSASAAATAVGTAVTTIKKLATPPGGKATLAFAEQTVAASSFTPLSDWTTANLVSDSRNSGDAGCAYNSTTLQNRMRIEFDQTATRCNGSSVNVFGKLVNAMSQVCMMAAILGGTDSSTLPASGTVSITDFSALIKGIKACGVDTSNVDITKITSFKITYTTPSSTATYDRFVQLAAVMGGQSMSQGMFIKYNATTVNVATGNFQGADLTGGSERMTLSMDRTNQIVKAEYLSGTSTGFNGYYFHRLYYDAKNDLGRVYSDIAMYSGTTLGSGTRSGQGLFIATAKPQTTTQTMALSVDFSGNFNNGSYSTLGSYDLSGCVNMSDGTIAAATVTSNAYTCSAVNGADIGAATTAAAAWALVGAVNWSNLTSASTPPTVAWDMTTMLTTNP